MREFIKNPYAERIRKNGCTIRVTRGRGNDKTTIEERVVTPEEIQSMGEQRDLILEERHIQR